MPEEDESGFLSRWSKRKRQLENEEKAPSPEVEEASGEDASAIEADSNGPTEEELEMQANLEAAEAVDLETLEYESDFEVFLKKGVPNSLKNAAMQKLWRSNPMLAVLDGLNDYDEDFGDAKLNVYKSAWEVGRGFLSDEEMNHNPADKVKAALEKLGGEESEQPVAAETPDDTETALETNETELAELEVTETELVPDPDLDLVENPEEEEPKRVSLRSRLFSDVEDAT